ncbi:protein Smaug homolog 2, partial [Myiozetetes cayanensis]|uniref:protein Smaug homolog 2 n=1 Tax=Myiozetetes cayanensis TaxID=478635 RepID=UPI002160D78E
MRRAWPPDRQRGRGRRRVSRLPLVQPRRGARPHSGRGRGRARAVLAPAPRFPLVARAVTQPRRAVRTVRAVRADVARLRRAAPLGWHHRSRGALGTPPHSPPCAARPGGAPPAREGGQGPPSAPPAMMFRDQVGIVAGWFRGWSECEQTVALLALLKRVTRTQARFLQLCL